MQLLQRALEVSLDPQLHEILHELDFTQEMKIDGSSL